MLQTKTAQKVQTSKPVKKVMNLEEEYDVDEVEELEEADVEIYEEPTVLVSKKKAPKVVEMDMEEENPGQYFHSLKRPIDYDGVVFDSIHFDFEAMNGSDLLLVEEEMARKNRISVGVELSKVNQYLLAVRGANKCKEENGFVMTSDLLEQLPMSDFNAICNATRRFFTQ